MDRYISYVNITCSLPIASYCVHCLNTREKHEAVRKTSTLLHNTRWCVRQNVPTGINSRWRHDRSALSVTRRRQGTVMVTYPPADRLVGVALGIILQAGAIPFFWDLGK
jgi:hypothetical protein